MGALGFLAQRPERHRTDARRHPHRPPGSAGRGGRGLAAGAVTPRSSRRSASPVVIRGRARPAAHPAASAPTDAPQVVARRRRARVAAAEPSRPRAAPASSPSASVRLAVPAAGSRRAVHRLDRTVGVADPAPRATRWSPRRSATDAVRARRPLLGDPRVHLDRGPRSRRSVAGRSDWHTGAHQQRRPGRPGGRAGHHHRRLGPGGIPGGHHRGRQEGQDPGHPACLGCASRPCGRWASTAGSCSATTGSQQVSRWPLVAQVATTDDDAWDQGDTWTMVAGGDSFTDRGLYERVVNRQQGCRLSVRRRHGAGDRPPHLQRLPARERQLHPQLHAVGSQGHRPAAGQGRRPGHREPRAADAHELDLPQARHACSAASPT